MKGTNVDTDSEGNAPVGRTAEGTVDLGGPVTSDDSRQVREHVADAGAKGIEEHR